CFLAEVSPFITILLLLQLVQMSFGAIRTPNISKNKNLSVSHLLTLPDCDENGSGENVRSAILR
ncbi:hypothetical protein HZB02_02785, partial [Candidatus Woesearchaeota archaeon]|nr:hypothetical protein [Candidatus Woesearchaeota archaeon]